MHEFLNPDGSISDTHKYLRFLSNQTCLRKNANNLKSEKQIISNLKLGIKVWRYEA